MPSFFVPARDTRHRIACLALYRALLRQVPRIPLPDELTSRPGWVHPIRYLIQSSFRRNKNDTSPRLIASAFKSGYRFLTMLVRAHDTSSPEYAEVTAFLHDRHTRFPLPEPSAEAKEPEPAVKPEPPVKPPPLLVKVSAEGEPPVYKSAIRPRPLSELSGGVRKVPVMDVTSYGISFLRISKPQSPELSNYLRRAGMRRQKRVTLFQELWEDAMVLAEEEDAWERILKEQAEREGVDIPDLGDEGGSGIYRVATSKSLTGPYQMTIQESLNHLNQKLNDEAEDWKARARAMLDIIDEEKKLAEKEKQERKETRLREKEERRRVWEEQQRQET